MRSWVLKHQRSSRAGSTWAREHRAARTAAAAVDQLLPDSPSLQGYVVREIDESLAGPLVRWLSRKPD